MKGIIENINWSPLFISLKTGIAATVFAFFFGIFAARLVMRVGKRTKWILDGILTLPLVLPPTVAGFFLLLLFSLRRSGARYIDCTIFGVGERSGNCDLREFVEVAGNRFDLEIDRTKIPMMEKTLEEMI